MTTQTTTIKQHIETLGAVEDALAARLWTLTGNDRADEYEAVSIALGEVKEAIRAVYEAAVKAGEL